MGNRYSQTLRIISMITLIAFSFTQVAFGYEGFLRANQARGSAVGDYIASAMGAVNKSRSNSGGLDNVRSKILQEIDSAEYLNGTTAQGQIYAYKRFVTKQTGRYNIHVTEAPHAFLDLYKNTAIDFQKYAFWILNQATHPFAKPLFNENGSLSEIQYYPKIKPYLTGWAMGGFLIAFIGYLFAGWPHSMIYVLDNFGIIKILSAVVLFSLPLFSLVLSFIVSKHGHELTHVYQLLILERVIKELSPNITYEKLYQDVRPSSVLDWPVDIIGDLPPTKEQLKDVVNALFEELNDILSVEPSVARAGGGNIDQTQAAAAGANAGGRSDPEATKKIICESARNFDIEYVRNPNVLAKWIIYFSTVKDDSVNMDRFVDFENVLDLVLAEIGQTQYRQSYVEALKNAVEYYGKQGLSTDDIPLQYCWRPYNVNDLNQKLLQLSVVYNPESQRLLPLDNMVLTDTGHGIEVAHSKEFEALEEQDLRDAAQKLNDIISKKESLSYDHLLDMHRILAQHLFIMMPGKIRTDISVSRDGREYPPYRSKFSSEEKRETAKRYGLDLPSSQSVIEIKLVEAELEGAKSIVEQEAKKPVQDKTALRLAEARLHAAEREKEKLESKKSLPELERLVEKYFRWLHKELAELDTIYLTTKDKSAAPKNQLYSHSAIFVAAQAFNRLINIHPFENGNTRASSLVANYILLRYGYPPFILSENNQKSFYNIERFGKFEESLFYDTWNIEDTKDWDEVQPADEELAAFFADEILKSTSSQADGVVAVVVSDEKSASRPVEEVIRDLVESGVFKREEIKTFSIPTGQRYSAPEIVVEVEKIGIKSGVGKVLIINNIGNNIELEESLGDLILSSDSINRDALLQKVKAASTGSAA